MVKPETQDINARLEQFAHFTKEFEQPSWIAPLRKAGMARFAELGYPTVHDEDWRFTNVAPIARLPFNPILRATADKLGPQDVSKFTFGRLAAMRLVFVDGHFAAHLS